MRSGGFWGRFCQPPPLPAHPVFLLQNSGIRKPSLSSLPRPSFGSQGAYADGARGACQVGRLGAAFGCLRRRGMREVTERLLAVMGCSLDGGWAAFGCLPCWLLTLMWGVRLSLRILGHGQFRLRRGHDPLMPACKDCSPGSRASASSARRRSACHESKHRGRLLCKKLAYSRTAHAAPVSGNRQRRPTCPSPEPSPAQHATSGFRPHDKKNADLQSSIS